MCDKFSIMGCEVLLGIYLICNSWTGNLCYYEDYRVPGSFVGCHTTHSRMLSTTDSLMLSTLECYYSNSDCLSKVMNHSKPIYLDNVEHPSWFDPRRLVYNSTLSGFPPKTLISTIVKNLMIEQWNSSLWYDRFYNSCAPSHCIYSERIRTKTLVDVMIALVSLIGGLILSQRLITPGLVKLFFYLFTKTNKREEEQQEGNR